MANGSMISKDTRSTQSVLLGCLLRPTERGAGRDAMKPTDQSRPIRVTLPPHGVFVLESHHGPGFRMTAERHAFLEIFYVLEGTGTFHLDGRLYPCCRGDIILVPVASEHHIEDNPAAPQALYGICLGPELWRQEPTLLGRLCAGRLPVSKLLAEQVRVDLRRSP